MRGREKEVPEQKKNYMKKRNLKSLQFELKITFHVGKLATLPFKKCEREKDFAKCKKRKKNY